MRKNSGELKILVIEDNPGDFILIEDYLSEEHNALKLQRAETFKWAKELLQASSNYDTILLDLSLPDIKDTEILVKEILALSNGTPVIVLTGYTNKAYGVKTLSWGVSDYLLKDEINASNLSKSIHYSMERKKVQRQLYESEEKYRTLFESSPLPMWVLDRHSLEFLSVNQAAIELYGYSREEFMQMTVRDLWAAEEDSIEKIVDENFHDLFTAKVQHHTKNREILYIEVQSNPILFGGREARVTLAHNITEKLKAEEKLKHSQQRFKALVQDGSDLISILDENYHYTYVSPSAKNILGVNPENLEGRDAFQFIHREDRAQIEEKIVYIGKVKSLQLPSYRYKDGSGQWRWLETIISDLRDDPAINGLVATSRDITNFKLQEKQLRESLERYDIVAKATSDLITDYNIEKDNFQYSNAIYDIFGYSQDKLGTSRAWWQERIHPKDQTRVIEAAKEIYEGGQKLLNIEYRFKCADGSYKYILDRSYVIIDASGKPARIIGSMQDITERRKYINAIERSNERLREIAWTQSHVVRAPLARIMGLIDLLKNQKNNLDNIEEIIDNILNSAEELDKVVRRITNKTEEEF
ncbi:PAS domain S-box protein [Salegentibacter salegens]|jgi:PAS domain S-box-containing protein|uniref:histidine kinase n=1 Tax=Salegentibacter salegens TaxID=143223 RepID=A0A1M7HEZ2_9FLAO|nr:PAS domain S-box protein [Salegentibacter salegens]PRX44098.1 PAS domain S-box-containing protein [Salegentibacter salegens]SHM27014.1 PAS domain S-box-containing protein [Salegentibacter salegens]